MADLLWEKVEDLFDPEMGGVLPDGCVSDTSVEDWQAVFDLVRSKGWRYSYSTGGGPVRMPRAETMFAECGEDRLPVLQVWPDPHVLVNFFAYAPESIDFDVDLRELQGQERLDVLCGFLRAIGRCLGKPVLMRPEGGDRPVLGFDVTVGHVVLMTEPR